MLISCLFMNGGAGRVISTLDSDNSPNLIVMNTVIASGTSGLVMLLSNQYQNILRKEQMIQKTGLSSQHSVSGVCKAIISGMVSVTACCNNISLYSACIVGFIGCVLYSTLSKVFKRYEIDDPLENSQAHGACGMWSLIASGLFDIQKGFLMTGNPNFFII